MVISQLGVHEVDREDAGVGTTTLKTGQDSAQRNASELHRIDKSGEATVAAYRLRHSLIRLN